MADRFIRLGKGAWPNYSSKAELPMGGVERTNRSRPTYLCYLAFEKAEPFSKDRKPKPGIQYSTKFLPRKPPTALGVSASSKSRVPQMLRIDL